MSRIAAGALLLALALMVALFAGRLQSGRDAAALPSPLIGRALAPFALPPLPGREKQVSADGLSLEDLKTDTVHVVNVFASWCVSCRLESEGLARLAERRDIALHGIDYKDEPKAALAYLAELGDPYDRVGLDASGRTAIDWGVYGVPETFVVDRAGRVVARLAGPLTAENMARVVLPAIAAAKQGS